MIDWDKPIKTTDGKRARVLAIDIKNDKYPVAVAYESEHGHEAVILVTKAAEYTFGAEPMFVNRKKIL